MFDLDGAVSAWRRRVELTSSLSPREVDELEDHLIARVDLEMELDRSLTRERAFRVATRQMGEAAALSREFTKAGIPRWRVLLATGWAMFMVSLFLLIGTGRGMTVSMAELIWESIRMLDVPGLILFALLNAPMFLTLRTLRRARPNGFRWLRWPLAIQAVGVTLVGIANVVVNGAVLGIGYWGYAASLACATLGIWLRESKRTSLRPLPGA